MSEERRGKLRRFAPLLVVFLVAIVVLLLAWRAFANHVPEEVILLSGRVEGDDAAIAAKTGGRILEVRVREGDAVEAGDTIATLDDQEVVAREDQARAALSDAEAAFRSAQSRIAVLQEQFRQSGLETEHDRLDAQGRVRQAEADLEAARADLAQQQAAYELAEFDREAYVRLASSGAVSEREGKASVDRSRSAGRRRHRNEAAGRSRRGCTSSSEGNHEEPRHSERGRGRCRKRDHAATGRCG